MCISVAQIHFLDCGVDSAGELVWSATGHGSNMCACSSLPASTIAGTA
jgi:hypothetical protein